MNLNIKNLKRNLNKTEKNLNKSLKRYEFNKKLLTLGINPFIKINPIQEYILNNTFKKKDRMNGYNIMIIKNNGDIDFKYNINLGKFLYMDYEGDQKIEYISNLTENKVKSINNQRFFIQISGRPSPEPSNNALDSKAFYEFYLAIDNENLELKKYLHRQSLGIMKLAQEKWWLIIIGIVILISILNPEKISGFMGTFSNTISSVGVNISSNIPLNNTLTTIIK